MHMNEEVNWYLEELSTSPAHLKLLDMSLGRLLRQAAANAKDWRMLCTDAQANLISDWLDYSLHEGASWLSNVDEFGKPTKLTKFRTVEQLEKEALSALPAQLKIHRDTSSATVSSVL